MKNCLLTVALLLLVAACGRTGSTATTNQSKASSCNYNGTILAVGEHFTAPDGCNSCGCSSNGRVSCTLMACNP